MLRNCDKTRGFKSNVCETRSQGPEGSLFAVAGRVCQEVALTQIFYDVFGFLSQRHALHSRWVSMSITKSTIYTGNAFQPPLVGLLYEIIRMNCFP